ncbi:restriction endonuclease subunit S [Lacticaseibacillus paracasei]|uniref:restriction endonuclease subunit S n=1 Tax=Lacticaseibacillus paracasei TaxID=1597 RepID=UPI003DA94E2B
MLARNAWEKRKSKALFSPSSQKGRPNLPVVSVTQDSGVVFRDKMDINIDYDRSTLGSYKVVKPGDFIISLRSFQGGFELSDKVGITSPAYTIFNFKKPEEHFSDFWKYLFKRYLFVQSLKSVTFGIRDGRSISFKDFSDLNIIFPSSKKEEETISRLLGLIDDLIAATQDKIDALEQAKRALLQRLFDQSWRFKGYSGSWEKHKLGDLAKRVRGNDGRMDLPILTISAGNGWLTQKERFSQSIAGNELKNYTLLAKNELSYNHGNSKLAKYGAVFALKKYNEALVPRVYHSFDVSGKADSNFIEYLFSSKTPDHELRKLISSGARMDGLLNINYASFMNISLLFPSIEEQQKISRILEIIRKLSSETLFVLSRLAQIKKDLLQELFI